MVKCDFQFKMMQDAGALDSDENDRVLRGIFGTVASINGVKAKEIHCIMHRYESGGVSFTPVKSVSEVTKAIGYAKKDSYLYIGKNAYVNKASFFSDSTVFGLHNLCIDIDNHSSRPDDVCGTLNILMQDIADDHGEYGIPMPSAIVYTGRGLQVWYYLKSASAELDFVATAIASDLCDKFQSMLDDSPLTYDGLEIDRAASERTHGMYRVPGSYNPDAGTYCQGKVISGERWDINKLKDALGVVIEPATRRSKPQKSLDGHITDTPRSATNNPFAKYLISFLYKIATTGNYESREVLCHIFHAKLLTFGIPEEDAEEQTYELNGMFDAPLKDSEIRALIKCDVKHYYRYSEKKIFEKIGVPESMVKEYYAGKGLLYKPRDYQHENASRDMAARTKKIEWHNQIRDLSSQGYTPSEISKMTGHALNTVKKIIQTPREALEQPTDSPLAAEPGKPNPEPESVDEAAQKKRAVSLYKRGFRSPQKIADIMEVNVAQADAYIADYKAYKKAQTAKNSLRYQLCNARKDIDGFKLPPCECGEQATALRKDIIDIDERITDLLRKLSDISAQNYDLIQAAEQDFGQLKVDLIHLTDRYAYAEMTGLI